MSRISNERLLDLFIGAPIPDKMIYDSYAKMIEMHPFIELVSESEQIVLLRVFISGMFFCSIKIVNTSKFEVLFK